MKEFPKDVVRNHIQDTCIERGYDVRSPEDVQRMTNKFVVMLEKHGDMYCPCHVSQNADTLCPCKYMREYGACRCGLFKKVEVTKK